MKKSLFIVSALLISLFIYLFYRTEKTVVNALLIRLVSIESYCEIRRTVNKFLSLDNFVVYSLPEGLWVFCITLTSKPYYLSLRNRRIDCLYIPFIFVVCLELFQLLHITNGRFDFLDIASSGLFWTLGILLFPSTGEKQNLFAPLNAKAMACLSSYGIVYLSHVI